MSLFGVCPSSRFFLSFIVHFLCCLSIFSIWFLFMSVVFLFIIFFIFFAVLMFSIVFCFHFIFIKNIKIE